MNVRQTPAAIIFGIVIVIMFTSCGTSSPEEGASYQLKDIRCDREIRLPAINEKTTIDVYENWVIIHFEDKSDVLVNRDKIWSLYVE